MSAIFFSSWDSLLRTVVIGVLAYVALVVILRGTGKRTLSKLNAFDLVVTVALGSTLSTILLNKDVALAEGTLSFLLLCGLQYAITWTSVRAQWIQTVVKSDPRLVVHRGQLLQSALKSERLTVEEIQAALRSAKLHDLSEADAVVLETDGSLSVIPRSDRFSADQLPGIAPPQSSSAALAANRSS